MVHWWNDTDRENWSTWIKTCLSATSSTKNTMRNCLGLNPASMVTGCQLSASLPQPWHSLLIYWLLCVCVKWLLLVTSHTAAVCDCVTVQMSIHEQTLYTPYTALSVWSAQAATLLLHLDKWPVFTNSCTDNGLTEGTITAKEPINTNSSTKNSQYTVTQRMPETRPIT